MAGRPFRWFLYVRAPARTPDKAVTMGFVVVVFYGQTTLLKHASKAAGLITSHLHDE